MKIRAAGLESLSSAALLAATRELVRKSHVLEAELLVHLGEIDERKLYLACAHPSMFAFCVGELGFSEAAAYDRIMVARAGRRLPALLDAASSGRVHLTGLRLLVPHLTEANQEILLAQAAGKSKREIEELVARVAPQEPAPALAARAPEQGVVEVSAHTRSAPSAAPTGSGVPPAPGLFWTAANGGSFYEQRDAPQPPRRHRPSFVPIGADQFQIQFTASSAFRDKVVEAQGLLRHRVLDGDLESILGRALDLLIVQVKKERFGVGRRARKAAAEAEMRSADGTSSRHIPDAIKRAVYERDGGRCTFTDERGRRCEETSGLVFDHVEGFARTHRHTVEGIRLLCRAHNQFVAEQMYGRAFMEKARERREAADVGGTDSPSATTPPTRAGTSSGTSAAAGALLMEVSDSGRTERSGSALAAEEPRDVLAAEEPRDVVAAEDPRDVVAAEEPRDVLAAERSPPPDARGATSGLGLFQRWDDGVEESAVGLDGDALRVELEAAQAAQLFAAAGVSGAAVEQLREDGTGAEGLAGDLLAADVDAAVVGGDGEHAVAEEVAIVAVHGADQPASAAAHQVGRRFGRSESGDWTEDFVLVE
jgi:5-methylcytosine-specific restriction endonuclease McrA